jgi:hypothetical protein
LIRLLRRRVRAQVAGIYPTAAAPHASGRHPSSPAATRPQHLPRLRRGDPKGMPATQKSQVVQIGRPPFRPGWPCGASRQSRVSGEACRRDSLSHPVKQALTKAAL